MKKLPIITLLSLFAISYSFAQYDSIHFSGGVFTSGTNIPIPNYTVYFYVSTDTMSCGGGFTHMETMTTDANGNFHCVFPYGCNPVWGEMTLAIPAHPHWNYELDDICDGCSAFIGIDPDSVSPCDANYVFWQEANTPAGIYEETFYALSPAPMYTFFWDFGDSANSTQVNPVHYYQQPGTYICCLTVTSQTGCTSTRCKTVTITSSYICHSNFSSTPLSLNSISFGNYSTGMNLNYYWDFGDGTNSVSQNPSHTFTQPGNYLVCLTVSSSTCSDMHCDTIYIAPFLPSQLNGQVFAGSNLLDHGMVYLYNQIPGTTLLNLLGSYHVDSAGYFYFTQVPPGLYYLKAVPDSASIYNNLYFPTYFQSTVIWSNATAINLGTASNPYNINLFPVPAPASGPGSITGNITQGFKVLSQGPPVKDIEILLLDMNNDPLSMDYSGTNGLFSFNNLDYGTYKVQGEVTGIPAYPVIVTLNPATPSSTVYLVITSSGISAGIQASSLNNAFSLKVFPNPADSHINLSFSSDKTRTASLNILNMTGELLESVNLHILSGNQQYTLDTHALSPGIYTLLITSDEGVSSRIKLCIVR